jgi:hypothetical protein
MASCPGWKVAVRESCGEASVTWSEGEDVYGEELRRQCAWVRTHRAEGDPIQGIEWVPIARELGSSERACGRARTELIRYIVHNHLRVLWTLTFVEPQFDREFVLGCVQRFFTALVKRYPKLPYVYVFEPHKSGALHVHFASRYIPIWELKAEWVRASGGVGGRVQFEKRRRWKGKGSPRQLGKYLGKYIGKDFEAGTPFGRHRYEVRRGFSPDVVREFREDFAEAVALVSGLVGQVDWLHYESCFWKDYRGPTCHKYVWDP